MKKYLLLAAFVVLGSCWTVAWAKIGTESEVATVLGISIDDFHRMEVALGQHQKLGRDATIAETVKEMVGRMNELVIREEEEVKRAEIEAEMPILTKIEAK